MKVRLHSNEESAARATDATLQGLSGNISLQKNLDGSIYFDEDGYAEILGNDLGFAKFAVVRQGYVKEVV